jgi:hypothetical protein
MTFPVKIRLVTFEAEQLLILVLTRTSGILTNPDVDNELISLYEFNDALRRKVINHRHKLTSKPIVYTFPLSIARILHRYLQEWPFSAPLQNVLTNLDQQLTNMNMKPKKKYLTRKI